MGGRGKRGGLKGGAVRKENEGCVRGKGEKGVFAVDFNLLTKKCSLLAMLKLTKEMLSLDTRYDGHGLYAHLRLWSGPEPTTLGHKARFPRVTFPRCPQVSSCPGLKEEFQNGHNLE